jgi:hypothetical protein
MFNRRSRRTCRANKNRKKLFYLDGQTARIGAVAATIIASLYSIQTLAQQATPPEIMQNLTPAQAEAVQSFLRNSQAVRDQALQQLTPEQRTMVTPLLSQPLPPRGGEIGGFVQASLPGNPAFRNVALPGANVYVRNADGEMDPSTITSTDGSGHFRIVSRPAGSYDICADLPGFATGCQNVAVAANGVVLPEPISLKPTGPALRGCVTLKDGSPAARGSVSSYQTAAEAKVSLVDTAGRTLAGPVPVNVSGCYVLTGFPVAEDLTVVVAYEAASAREIVTSRQLTSAPPSTSFCPRILRQSPDSPPVWTAPKC